MAKTNRFYLLIAALICTHSYDVSAAVVDCGNIEHLDTAKDECYDYWTDRVESGDLTRQEHSNTFDGTDAYICEMWEDTGHAEDPDAQCQKIDTISLAEYCCRFHTNGEGPCVNVLLGWDTCASTDTGGDSGGDITYWDCAGDDGADWAHYNSAITKVTDYFQPGIEYSASDIERQLGGYDPDSLCHTEWNGDNCSNGSAYDSDYNLQACATCEDPIIDDMVAVACSGTDSPDTCWDIYTEKIQCQESEQPCGSGTYMSSGQCVPCPVYETYDGSENPDILIWSNIPAYAKTQCYVPAGTEIENDIGAFVFDFNCNYSGS